MFTTLVVAGGTAVAGILLGYRKNPYKGKTITFDGMFKHTNGRGEVTEIPAIYQAVVLQYQDKHVRVAVFRGFDQDGHDLPMKINFDLPHTFQFVMPITDITRILK